MAFPRSHRPGSDGERALQGAARQHRPRGPVLRRPGARPPEPADALVRPPPADVLPGHGRRLGRLRQHVASRPARLPVGARLADRGLAGVPRERCDGQHGQHRREPAGGAAAGRLRRGHRGPARQRAGGLVDVATMAKAGVRADSPAGGTARLWVRVEVEEAYIHCSKHIPRFAEAPAGEKRPYAGPAPSTTSVPPPRVAATTRPPASAAVAPETREGNTDSPRLRRQDPAHATALHRMSPCFLRTRESGQQVAAKWTGWRSMLVRR